MGVDHALWVKEVAPQRDLAVTWRSYCLEIRDDYGVAPTVPENLRDAALAGHALSHRMLRIFEAARAQAGEEAVDAPVHANGAAGSSATASGPRRRPAVGRVWPRAGSLPSSSAPPTTTPGTPRSCEAMEVAYAFGGPKTQTPTIVVRADPPYGFKGPVMAPAPTGDAAVAPVGRRAGHRRGARVLRDHPTPRQPTRGRRADLSRFEPAPVLPAAPRDQAGIRSSEHPGDRRSPRRPRRGRWRAETTVWECTMNSAPTTAPRNMATTVRPRRPALAPVRPAMGPSAEIPVMVIVSTVVVRSGTASFRAAAFWIPMEMPRTTIKP